MGQPDIGAMISETSRVFRPHSFCAELVKFLDRQSQKYNHTRTHPHGAGGPVGAGGDGLDDAAAEVRLPLQPHQLRLLHCQRRPEGVQEGAGETGGRGSRGGSAFTRPPSRLWPVGLTFPCLPPLVHQGSPPCGRARSFALGLLFDIGFFPFGFCLALENSSSEPPWKCLIP